MSVEITAMGSARMFRSLKGGQTIVFDGGPVQMVLTRPERADETPQSFKRVRIHLVVETDDPVLPEILR